MDGWSDIQCVMSSDLIVLPEPGIDYELTLFDAVEPFSIKRFSSKCSVEAFLVSILPSAAWIDLDRFNIYLSKPRLKMFGNELWAVIWSNILGFATLYYEIKQYVKKIIGVHLWSYGNA